MKRVLRVMMLLSIVLVSVVRAGEIQQVTGVEWTKSTAEQKKSYLIGMANIAEVEMAYQGQVSDDQSMLPRMRRGLKGQTLDSVREGLDKWYAANPGKLDRPVIETIWFEMVLPGLRNNK